MSFPRIAIVGAGPSGLTLARILVNNSITPHVFEGDPSPDYRPQGGTLDLHERSGLLALREAGLWDEFLKHARYDGQETKVIDKHGNVIMQDRGTRQEEKGAKPEIDRTALRNMLLRSINPELIHWGHALEFVESTPTRTYNLHFKHGRVESGYDLVVGADGTWSRVRPLVTSVEPFYSGTCFIELVIPDPTGAEYAEVNALVGRGSLFAMGDCKTIMAQRLGDDSIRVYVAFSNDEGPTWAEQFVKGPADEVRAKILSHFEGWKDTLLNVLRLTEGSIIPRPLYMFPVGHRWEARPGVTLLGDAGHVMTPYAGEGVNVAMWGALELAKAIVAGVKEGDLDEKIRESELKLFRRAKDSARRTERNLRMSTNSNFSKESMEEIIKKMEKKAGRLLRV